MKYIIQMLVDFEPERWFNVATCLTPESAAEVVRVLLQGEDQPGHYRIEVVHV